MCTTRWRAGREMTSAAPTLRSNSCCAGRWSTRAGSRRCDRLGDPSVLLRDQPRLEESTCKSPLRSPTNDQLLALKVLAGLGRPGVGDAKGIDHSSGIG